MRLVKSVAYRLIFDLEYSNYWYVLGRLRRAAAGADGAGRAVPAGRHHVVRARLRLARARRVHARGALPRLDREHRLAELTRTHMTTRDDVPCVYFIYMYICNSTPVSVVNL